MDADARAVDQMAQGWVRYAMDATHLNIEDPLHGDLLLLIEGQWRQHGFAHPVAQLPSDQLDAPLGHARQLSVAVHGDGDRSGRTKVLVQLVDEAAALDARVDGHERLSLGRRVANLVDDVALCQSTREFVGRGMGAWQG